MTFENLELELSSLNLTPQDKPVEALKSLDTPVWSSEDQRQVMARAMHWGVLICHLVLHQADPATPGRVNHILLFAFITPAQQVSHRIVSGCVMYLHMCCI